MQVKGKSAPFIANLHIVTYAMSVVFSCLPPLLSQVKISFRRKPSLHLSLVKKVSMIRMAQLLRQSFQGREMFCHDPRAQFVGSNPNRVKLTKLNQRYIYIRAG